tara:strand:+ start:734 stop:1411 length:678 start_codon:yes stop_codon:yes gene_type:complete
MLGFHAFSEAPFSDLAGDIKLGSSSLSSVATVSATPTVHIAARGSKQVDADLDARGQVIKLGQADIKPATNPFDDGFDFGFQFGGVVLKGDLTRERHSIPSTATIVADGTVILGDVIFAGLATLESQTNFTGKSVLLHSARAGFNLSGGARFDSARFSSVFEKADTVLFTLYLDKGLDLSGYIDKERLLTLYADKSLASTLYVDKDLSSSKYIDKELEQILVREK